MIAARRWHCLFAFTVLFFPAMTHAAPPENASTIICAFDPPIENAEDMGVGKVYAELSGTGPMRHFEVRMPTPSPGYSGAFGKLRASAGDVMLPLRLTAPSGGSLTVIDAVTVGTDVNLPHGAKSLRVVIEQNFNWGSRSIICPLNY